MQNYPLNNSANTVETDGTLQTGLQEVQVGMCAHQKCKSAWMRRLIRVFDGRSISSQGFNVS